MKQIIVFFSILLLCSSILYAANSVITMYGSGNSATSSHITIGSGANLCPDQIVYSGTGASVSGSICGSLAVELSSFKTKIKDSSMVIEWATASEKDNAGFNIWRSESENGVYEKINSTLIPANGSSTTGVSYVYNDDNIKLGKKYCYKLEDVDTKGNSQFHKTTGSFPCFNVLLGDANGDGKIDLKDAAYILQITSDIRNKK